MSNKNNKNRDNNEKKKSYFDITRKKRTKNLKTFVLPIVGGVAILTVISVFLFSPGGSSGFGALGSAHEHAAFLVKINGKNIDFSIPKYQVQSDYIHVENGDGTTLHRHATNVTLGDFLDSVKMNIDKENNNNNCFMFDNGTKYCDDTKNKLNTFINGNKTGTEVISNYVINNNDRLLVIYGNETEDDINRAVKEVNDLTIQFT
jgi:hypothetical protein